MANSRARTAKVVLYDPVDCLVVVPETGCSVIPVPFVEKTICSPLSCLHSFIKGHLIYVGVFWALYCYIDLFSICLPIPLYLHYCIQEALKLGNVSPSTQFPFSIEQDIVDILPFHLDFIISLLLSLKQFAVILIEMVLTL